MFSIKMASKNDINTVVSLSLNLWKDNNYEDLKQEFLNLLISDNAVIYLCFFSSEPIGFAQCQLRYDYVEGTQTSPVGYLEGIFVAEKYRRKGIAKELLKNCESWAKEKGCLEFASDCEFGNNDSLKFHKSLGFTQANTIICFTKKL